MTDLLIFVRNTNLCPKIIFRKTVSYCTLSICGGSVYENKEITGDYANIRHNRRGSALKMMSEKENIL